MKCSECNRQFPSGYVQPMITTRGNTFCCAVCALAIRNEIHGLNDKKFQGTEANKLLRKTQKYLKEKL